MDEGTRILLSALEQQDLSGRLLDLGCGYGVLGIVLKKINPNLEVDLTDINPRAIELAKLNCELNQVKGDVILSDGFKEIQKNYQTIITNPPIRAGKKVIYTLFADAYQHLEEEGKLYVVIRRKQGAESAKAKLEEVFGNCEVLLRKRGYWVLYSTKGNRHA